MTPYLKSIKNNFLVIKALVLGCLLCMMCECGFADYGESCSVVPSSSNFLNNTTYGYIKSLINMQECNDTSLQLVLCVAYDPALTQTTTKPAAPATKPTPNTPTTTPAVPPALCSPETIVAGGTVTLGPGSSWGTINAGLASTVMQNITLNVTQIENKLCLTMNTSEGANTPMLCKDVPLNPTPDPTPASPQCTLLDGSCGNPTSSHSMSVFNFSGVAYQCLASTLQNIFQGNSCMNGENSVTFLNPFSEFQKVLRKSISAALVIYVIFYGIRLVLGQEDGSKKSVAGFILKILFVVYFTVGFNVGNGSSESERQNGISTYLLPILLQVTQGFSNIIISAGGGDGSLCVFDTSQYDEGYEYYALWDAIDCRMAYYLGMNAASNISKQGSFTDTTIVANFLRALIPPNSIPCDIQSYQGGNVPPILSSDDTLLSFFMMLLGLLLSFNITILIFSLAFLILFIGLMMQFISSYLVCLLTLYIMMYVAPIFVPMILFKRTKGYFDSWLTISVSVALQPAILISFIAFMLTMFDTAMYNTCVFARNDYSITSTTDSTNTRNVSVFTLMLPGPDVNHPNNQEHCKESPGYKMLEIFNGYGWTDISFILIRVYFLLNTYIPTMELLRVLIFWIIFYFFSQQMSAFAANITNGPNLNNITGSLGKLVGAISEKIEARKDNAEKKRMSGKNAKGSK